MLLLLLLLLLLVTYQLLEDKMGPQKATYKPEMKLQPLPLPLQSHDFILGTWQSAHLQHLTSQTVIYDLFAGNRHLLPVFLPIVNNGFA